MSKPITRSNSKADSSEIGSNTQQIQPCNHQDLAEEIKLVTDAIGMMRTSLDTVLEKLNDQSQLIQSLKEENSALISKMEEIEAGIEANIRTPWHNNHMQIHREISEQEQDFDQQEPTEGLSDQEYISESNPNLTQDERARPGVLEPPLWFNSSH